MSVQIYSSCYVDVFYKDLHVEFMAPNSKVGLTMDIIDEYKPSVFLNVADENKLKVFEERLKKGKKAIVALVGNSIVCYVWISFQDEYEPISGLSIRLNGVNGYIHDTFVLPEFREKGIHSAVVFRALEYLKQKGYAGAVTVVKRTNTPSIRTFKKFGFKEKQSFRTTKILWFKFKSCIWQTPGFNIAK